MLNPTTQSRHYLAATSDEVFQSEDWSAIKTTSLNQSIQPKPCLPATMPDSIQFTQSEDYTINQGNISLQYPQSEDFLPAKMPQLIQSIQSEHDLPPTMAPLNQNTYSEELLSDLVSSFKMTRC